MRPPAPEVHCRKTEQGSPAECPSSNRPAVPANTPSKADDGLVARLRRVRLLLCDVDGVPTDGAVWTGADSETKAFNIRDGMGLALLRRAGIKLGWISSRRSPATAQRAAELGVEFLHQDETPKVAAIEGILARAGCGWDAVCYVGDDLVDLGAMRRAGLAVAVADAVTEVKASAYFTTLAPGGQGAVRELAERILRAQGQWEKLVAEFDQ